MRTVQSKFMSVLLFSSVFLLSLSGCGGGSSGGGSGTTISSIAITPATASVATGATQQFTAVAKDSAGATVSGVTFTWASSNTGVATISSSGLATGVAAGSANITAKAGGVTSNTSALTVTAPASVTGTAAKGTAIGGATITLVDSAGKTATATTAADGTFTLDTSGLTPPFMVKVVAGSTTLYSVSADANASTVINVTPLTDLVIRSWYSVQGNTVDSGFSKPATDPPPSPTEVKIIGNVVVQVMQLWLQNAGVDTSATGFSLISTPFTADGTGLDQVLDETTINSSTGAISITDGTTTQNSTVTYDTSTGSVNVDTTTTGTGGASSSSTGTTIPISSAQQSAFDAITAMLNTFAGIVNTKGAALTDTDILPYLDANLLNEGLDQAQFAASVATQFRGVTVSFAVESIASLDTTNGIADVNFTLTQTQGSASQTQQTEFYFKQQTDGSWLLYGDQRVAKPGITSEMRINQGAINTGSGPDINVDIRPLQGIYSGITVNGGGIFNNTALTQGPTEVDTYSPTPTTSLVVKLDAFFANSGVLTNLVPAGTPITVTLTPVSGSPVSYTIDTNAFTTEPISITSPTGSTLADATLGTALHLTWTLPKTFAIQEVKLNAQTFTGDQTLSTTLQCQVNGPVLGVTATSGDITLPATCSGQPVLQANVTVEVTGVNGERETDIYSFQ